MLSWSYKGGFSGNYLCVGKMVASIAQGRRKRHPCAQSARRQRPCCRHFRRCISSSKKNMHLTQVALVARPCAPAAQQADDSSSSCRWLAISLCRFAPLDIEQDCSFRMPLTKWKCLVKSFGQIDSSRIKHHLPKLRSDSFQKLWMLRNRLDLISSLHSVLILPISPLPRRRDDFQKRRGERAQRVKKLPKSFNLYTKYQKFTFDKFTSFPFLYIAHIKFILIFLEMWICEKFKNICKL